MKINTTSISYKETGFFSKIVIDYLEQAEQLEPFYNYPVSIEGLSSCDGLFNTLNRNWIIVKRF